MIFHETRGAEEWETFYEERTEGDYPQWPNESMLKIVFGGYLERKVELDKASRVLDIGCGFGNNLLPFLDRGYECYGVEITSAIAERTQTLLQKRGFRTVIKPGHNRELPFPDDFIDLAISINALHYEKDETHIQEALAEYRRVLKPGGAALIITVGPEHEIYRQAEVVGCHQFEIRDYDFRDGERYFYFSNSKYLDSCLRRYFVDIELGRVTENLMTVSLDFLIAVCRKDDRSS